MKTILVATDFSSSATNAVHYAADMAMALDAELYLFHVHQVPFTYSEIPAALNEEELLIDAEVILTKLREELERQTNGRIKVQAKISSGLFYSELKSICEKIKPYSVVMGSQGTTAATRLFFGNHTIYAMKNLQWPLITVPPTSKFSTVKKVGLATDFDNVKDITPIDEIKKLVNDFHAELHILNTGRKEEFNPDLIIESSQIENMLGDLNPKIHFITHENTEEGIIEFAENNKINLLIVLPKSHTLTEKLMQRSITKQLILHSHIPVMALHQ